jgi:hypothetical protein
MATAMLYIVTEWCLQSHLSTANMANAARGLRLTRRFRWLTSPFRDAVHYATEGVYAARTLFSRVKKHDETDSQTEARQHRRSVRWTKSAAARETPLNDLTPGRHRASSSAPLIEDRDASVIDADAASYQSQVVGSQSQSPRASNEDQIVVGLEAPSSLNLPEARSVQ